MWICRYCETENPDAGSSCVCCGQRKQAEENTAVMRGKNYGRKKAGRRKKILACSLAAAAVAAALLLCFFTIHIWAPAACASPQTCVICGKTRGLAPGHVWREASCTETQICTVCGETGQAALGHDWLEATYDSPEICSRCGLRSGNVKGYVGAISGEWNDEKLYLGENQATHAFELTAPLENCFRLTMELTLTSYRGDPFGKWCLFARTPDGKWFLAAEFELKEDMVDQEQAFSFEFDPAVSLDALSIVMKGNGSYSLSYQLSFSEAQVREN